MSFDELLRTVGLWPALAIILAWGWWKLVQEIISDLRKERDDLRAEARKAIEEKNAELNDLRKLFYTTAERRPQ